MEEERVLRDESVFLLREHGVTLQKSVIVDVREQDSLEDVCVQDRK
jgi:hypothetical protein